MISTLIFIAIIIYILMKLKREEKLIKVLNASATYVAVLVGLVAAFGTGSSPPQ